MKLNRMKRLTLILTLVALLLQWAGLSLHAREGRESSSGKWRPKEGSYALAFYTDDKKYGGSGITESKFRTLPISMHGFEQSVSISLAGNSVIYLERVKRKKK